MKKVDPLFLAAILVLSCILYRLMGSIYPEFVPNISPLMALSLVAAIYFPRRWGWMVGPMTFILSDLAFLKLNYLIEGSVFSWWTLISLAIYLFTALLGRSISSRKSLIKILGGSILCSTLFYCAANTFSWIDLLAPKWNPGYAFTFSGWMQANTVGLPGFVPTWIFLRNGLMGDLFFTMVLLLILDPEMILKRVWIGNRRKMA